MHILYNFRALELSAQFKTFDFKDKLKRNIG